MNPRSTLVLAVLAITLASCQADETPAPSVAPDTAATAPAPAPASVGTTSSTPSATGAQSADTVAARYEGKIVKQPGSAGGKDDGWYLVQGGKRRWITDASWLGAHGYTPESVIEIPAEEFRAIPEDPTPLTQ